MTCAAAIRRRLNWRANEFVALLGQKCDELTACSYEEYVRI